MRWIDKNARDANVTLLESTLYEAEMALMQGAHCWYECYCFAFFAKGMKGSLKVLGGFVDLHRRKKTVRSIMLRLKERQVTIFR